MGAQTGIGKNRDFIRPRSNERWSVKICPKDAAVDRPTHCPTGQTRSTSCLSEMGQRHASSCQQSIDVRTHSNS